MTSAGARDEWRAAPRVTAGMLHGGLSKMHDHAPGPGPTKCRRDTFSQLVLVGCQGPAPGFTNKSENPADSSRYVYANM